MRYHVTVLPEVSQLVPWWGLSRAAMLRVFTTLHDELTDNADKHRGNRDAKDPDFFHFRIRIADGGRWHFLDFAVNDAPQPGR